MNKSKLNEKCWHCQKNLTPERLTGLVVFLKSAKHETELCLSCFSTFATNYNRFPEGSPNRDKFFFKVIGEVSLESLSIKKQLRILRNRTEEDQE